MNDQDQLLRLLRNRRASANFDYDDAELLHEWRTEPIYFGGERIRDGEGITVCKPRGEA